MAKPKCCGEEMDWLMASKSKEAFLCPCGRLVVRDKRTGEETWFRRIGCLDDLLDRFPHLARD